MTSYTTDINGSPIRTGEVVVLCDVPPELVRGLPDDDIRAIKAQVGARMEVVGFDSFGNVELEFASSADTFHTVFVSGQILKKVD